MRSTLSNFNYRWNDALLKIAEVKEMKGESGVSIRKGKKIVSYDYAITLKWSCAMMAMEGGTEVASCEGTYEMPEISNEEEVDDWEIRVSYSKDTDNLKAVLS
jgi:activator of HSP90 ATPase